MNVVEPDFVISEATAYMGDGPRTVNERIAARVTHEVPRTERFVSLADGLAARGVSLDDLITDPYAKDSNDGNN